MKYNKIFANELPAAIKAFVMMRFPMLSIAFAMGLLFREDCLSLQTNPNQQSVWLINPNQIRPKKGSGRY